MLYAFWGGELHHDTQLSWRSIILHSICSTLIPKVCMDSITFLCVAHAKHCGRHVAIYPPKMSQKFQAGIQPSKSATLSKCRGDLD